MNDAEFQKLLNATPSLVLIASRKKSFLIVLGSALFVAASILMIHDPNNHRILMGWIGLLFFGAALLAGLWILLVPKSHSLTLDRQGFTVKAIWHEHGRAWKDVSAFVAKALSTPIEMKQIDLAANIMKQTPPIPLSRSRMGLSKKVFFDDGSTGKKAEFNRRLAGYSCAISNDYGLSADQLAQLMNHWRERALKQNG